MNLPNRIIVGLHGLIRLHGLSDTLIALAYISIPPTLIYLVRKKPFDWMFVCFGCFIAACGATHLMEVVTLWTPVYWISGGVKVITIHHPPGHYAIRDKIITTQDL